MFFFTFCKNINSINTSVHSVSLSHEISLLLSLYSLLLVDKLRGLPDL